MFRILTSHYLKITSTFFAKISIYLGFVSSMQMGIYKFRVSRSAPRPKKIIIHLNNFSIEISYEKYATVQ